MIEDIKRCLLRVGTESEVFKSARDALMIPLEHNIAVDPINQATAPLRGFIDAAIIETDIYEPWTMNLVIGVAGYLGAYCYIVKLSETDIVYHALCRSENVAAIRLIVEYLREHMRRINRLTIKGRKFDRNTRHSFRRAFRLGNSQRLRSYLEDRPDVPFIIQEFKDLEEWMFNEGYSFEKRHIRNRKAFKGKFDYFAYNEGVLTADKVILDPRLTHIPEGATQRGPRAR